MRYGRKRLRDGWEKTPWYWQILVTGPIRLTDVDAEGPSHRDSRVMARIGEDFRPVKP